MVVVVATALVGGLCAGGLVGARRARSLLNYLFTPPLYTLTIADPENAFAIAIFVVVGIAVASVVDTRPDARPRRAPRAPRPTRWPCWRTACSPAGDDLPSCWPRACELFGMPTARP